MEVNSKMATLDDANNIVISVSHCALRGDRILTMVVAANYSIPTT